VQKWIRLILILVETNSGIKDSNEVDTSTGRKVVRRSSAK